MYDRRLRQLELVATGLETNTAVLRTTTVNVSSVFVLLNQFQCTFTSYIMRTCIFKSIRYATAFKSACCHYALQTRAVKTLFVSIRCVTRCTSQRELVGSQQSTDVCLTTPVWPSLMTTFANTFPALCCRTRRGLD